jgi:ABC-type phosphonate transport system ATPase subunit
MKNEEISGDVPYHQEFPPGVRALDDVDFDLFCGETPCVDRETRAGKSTLCKDSGRRLPRLEKFDPGQRARKNVS